MRFIDTTAVRRFDPARLCKVNLFDAPPMFCDVYCLEPGQAQKVHAHADAVKFYYVIEGRGAFTVGGERRVLGPGGLAYSMPGEPHGVENASTERLVLLVAMGPSPNKPPV